MLRSLLCLLSRTWPRRFDLFSSDRRGLTRRPGWWNHLELLRLGNTPLVGELLSRSSSLTFCLKRYTRCFMNCLTAWIIIYKVRISCVEEDLKLEIETETSEEMFTDVIDAVFLITEITPRSPVVRPSVPLSLRPGPHDIWRRPWGTSFRFGTNVHLD